MATFDSLYTKWYDTDAQRIERAKARVAIKRRLRVAARKAREQGQMAAGALNLAMVAEIDQDEGQARSWVRAADFFAGTK